MAFTYTSGTDIGQVRLKIMDTVDAGHIFEDAEIQDFLDMNEDSVRLAAADALEAMAANKALLSKRIKSLDIEVDNRGAADSLLKLADRLREQEDDDGHMEIAELVTNDFSERERIWKQMLRGAI